jgi:hypothetical protein
MNLGIYIYRLPGVLKRMGKGRGDGASNSANGEAVITVQISVPRPNLNPVTVAEKPVVTEVS